MAIELSEKQIKDGWQIVKFGEIAKEMKSTTKDPAEDGLEFYVGLEHLDPQSLRIARKGIIAEDNPSFTRRFSAGQILFGKRRCYQKKAAVADFDGICSGDIIVMDAVPKKIIPGLLPFIIQSDAFFDWAEKTSSGSLSPRTKWKSLAEFEFPLPPIERQKEILEVLEKLEENKRRTLDALDSLVRIKYLYGYYRCEDIDSDQIPLIKIGELKNGVNKSKSDFGKGSPFVNLDDVFASESISSEPSGLVKVSKSEIDNYSLKKNDILFVRSSVKPSGVALTAIITEDLKDTVYAGFLIRLRPKSQFDAQYLNYCFHEPHFRHRIMAYVTISANSNINQDGLEKAFIYYPDSAERNQVKEFYSRTEKSIQAFKKKELTLNHLSRSVTDKLLAGGVQ